MLKGRWRIKIKKEKFFSGEQEGKFRKHTRPSRSPWLSPPRVPWPDLCRLSRCLSLQYCYIVNFSGLLFRLLCLVLVQWTLIAADRPVILYRFPFFRRLPVCFLRGNDHLESVQGFPWIVGAVYQFI